MSRCNRKAARSWTAGLLVCWHENFILWRLQASEEAFVFFRHSRGGCHTRNTASTGSCLLAGGAASPSSSSSFRTTNQNDAPARARGEGLQGVRSSPAPVCPGSVRLPERNDCNSPVQAGGAGQGPDPLGGQAVKTEGPHPTRRAT